MKRFITFLWLIPLFLGTAFATKYTITSPGMVFSPSTLTARVGDTILFAVSATHTATQVSQNTWNSNGTTVLPGGFDYNPGNHEYVIKPSDVGTIYYICVPHVTMGMKGRIFVEDALGVEPAVAATAQLKVFPTLTTEGETLTIEFPEAKLIQVEILNMLGVKISSLETNDSKVLIPVTFGRGAYFVRASVNNKTYIKKFVVN